MSRPSRALWANALALACLVVVGAVVAIAPRLLAQATPRLLFGELIPWIGIATAWGRRTWTAAATRALRWTLPSDLFRDTLVVGGAAVAMVRVATFLGEVADRPTAVAAATTVEDFLYDLGLLSLAALGAFAITRTVLRPSLRSETPPATARDISLRTRFVVTATGTSFATAGVLLDVLVDFERTPDDVSSGTCQGA